MASGVTPGLRPLSPITATPKDYPGGGGCKCSWSFLPSKNMWLLKYMYYGCMYRGGAEGAHFLLAEKIAAYRNSTTGLVP